MCDNNGSATLHCAVQSYLHDLLTVLIKGRRCLVENEDFRVLDQCSRNSDTLLLSTTELAALGTTFLVEAFV